MRGALLVISVCALLFLGLASASPNAIIVGKVGNVIGSANYKAFGVVALFYPFFLIYPVIRGFQNIKKLNLHFYSRAIGVFLLVLAILLSVSMFKPELGGAFGNWSIESLKSFFGNIGTIVFVIMIYMISFGLVFDDR
nr:DNA translocase FtsK 4TM domain-containing protein [Campylobacter sp.]